MFPLPYQATASIIKLSAANQHPSPAFGQIKRYPLGFSPFAEEKQAISEVNCHELTL
jgi:hypothetical protein